MSKSHSNQKGQNMKNKNPSDATTQDSNGGQDNLDSNQSNQSMNASSSNAVQGSAHDVDPVTAMDNEGGATQPGQQDQVDGQDRSQSSDQYDSASEGSLMSKAAHLLDNQTVKKNLNLVKDKAQGVKDKAQDFYASSREQVGAKLHTMSDDVRLRGMMVDDSIKTNPYAYALGAVGIGFILGRAFSGKGRGDLDALVSTVNKLNLGTLTGMLGVKTDSATREQPNYNSDQARHIG